MSNFDYDDFEEEYLNDDDFDHEENEYIDINELEKESFMAINISLFIVYVIMFFLMNKIFDLLKFLPYKIQLIDSIHITFIISLVTSLIAYLISHIIFGIIVEKQLIEDTSAWVKHIFTIMIKLILDLIIALFLQSESFTKAFSIPFKFDSLFEGITLIYLRPTVLLILAFANLGLVKKDKTRIIYLLIYGLLATVMVLLEYKSYY